MDLHIITLNIPYPPDYGGMIDTFYRIKSLHSLGVKIHLHCFEYGRKHSVDLESLCKTVNYYPRKTRLLRQFSKLPYIVSSRRSKVLLQNLIRNDYPVLFDGLHTTFYLSHPFLSKRKKLVRTHNIESLYYKDLAKNEPNLIKKAFFLLESYKLRRYEALLGKSDFILAISESDQKQLQQNFENVIHIPPFHKFENCGSLTGIGEYILYHGDLSVQENASIADSLILNTFSRVTYRCIIAGKNPPDMLRLHASRFSNIRVFANPDEETMQNFIINAQINVLPAKSANGFKLKILSALFAGRHCVVNTTVADAYPSIKQFCNIADTDEEIIEVLDKLMKQPFTVEMIHKRQKLLNEQLNVEDNAKKVVEMIFENY